MGALQGASDVLGVVELLFRKIRKRKVELTLVVDIAWLGLVKVALGKIQGRVRVFNFKNSSLIDDADVSFRSQKKKFYSNFSSVDSESSFVCARLTYLNFPECKCLKIWVSDKNKLSRPTISHSPAITVKRFARWTRFQVYNAGFKSSNLWSFCSRRLSLYLILLLDCMILSFTPSVVGNLRFKGRARWVISVAV